MKTRNATQHKVAAAAGVTRAILCWNDAMALGVYAWLRDRGVRVPADVSVTGFDDWLAGAALPPLSTVSFEFHRIGAEAARLAMRLAEGTLKAAEARRTVVDRPSRFVVERKSTGPVPAGRDPEGVPWIEGREERPRVRRK